MMGRSQFRFARHRDERGIALMVVIWVVGLLALQATLINGNVRDAVLLAENEAAIVRGEALVRAGAEVAVSRLLAKDARAKWVADGRSYDANIAGQRVVLQLSDERTRINLNLADEAHLTRLFHNVSGSAREGEKLAKRFLAWRKGETQTGANTTRSEFATASETQQKGNKQTDTAQRRLQDAADVGRVLQLDPLAFRRLMSLVTVHGADAKINPLLAPDAVLRTLPEISPEVLEDLLGKRRLGQVDLNVIEAALSPARDRLDFSNGTILRLRIEVAGKDPLAMGGAEIILQTGVDAAAPYRVLAWVPSIGDKAEGDVPLDLSDDGKKAKF